MSFQPKFEKYKNLDGFDDSINPHWQMVPLDGEKSVYLRNADGLTVQVVNPNIAQVSEVSDYRAEQTDNRRLFTVKGLTYGTTFLEARKNNIVQTRLEVAVKKLKTVSLAFNFVADRKRSTDKSISYVAGWMEALNDIYLPQTNIKFIEISANNLSIDNDLGPEIDFTDARGSNWEYDVIVKQADAGADINLFFVWKITDRWQPGEAFFPKGETWKSNCFIGDWLFISKEVDKIVIAHEIGHALGIPGYQHLFHPKNRSRYMMYYRSKFAGREIMKIHANMVNK